MRLLRRCRSYLFLGTGFGALFMMNHFFKDKIIFRFELSEPGQIIGPFESTGNKTRHNNHHDSPCSSSHRAYLPQLDSFLKARSPRWMSSIGKKSPFFLVEVLQVRIYSTDKAKWSIAELKQWIHFMFWAGVDHIYLCDHYKYHHERLDGPLKRYIDLDLITYLPWNASHSAMAAQINCYLHVRSKYGNLTTWTIGIDMDEYPFVFGDYQEGFLKRYLQKQEEIVKVIHLQNFLMLGQGNRSMDMVTERINRITPEKANNLSKPIYRPKFAIPGIHTARLLNPRDRSVQGHASEIRMLHYWGSRLQNWGPDTEEVLKLTVEFNIFRENVAPFIRLSMLAFGECDAFNSTTGP